MSVSFCFSKNRNNGKGLENLKKKKEEKKIDIKLINLRKFVEKAEQESCTEFCLYFLRTCLKPGWLAGWVDSTTDILGFFSLNTKFNIDSVG